MQVSIDYGLHQWYEKSENDWCRLFHGSIACEIIVLGSSRAKRQFVPEIIQARTDKSCYNLGINGGGIVLQRAKWESYLGSDPSAKVILQNIDFQLLSKRKDLFGKEEFLPYISKPSIYNNIVKIDPFVILESFVPLIKYRGYYEEVLKSIKSYINISGRPVNIRYDGYEGKDWKWNNDFDKFLDSLGDKTIAIQESSIEFGLRELQLLVDDCKEKDIELILVHAPYYSDLYKMIPEYDVLMSHFQSFAHRNGIELWDYSRDEICKNKAFFFNSSHLNNTGAKLFSSNLAERLSSHLKQKQDFY